MSIVKNIPAYPSKTFNDGYLDGYQSLRPGVVPSVPPYNKVPTGLTPYQWGFTLGEDDARAAGLP